MIISCPECAGPFEVPDDRIAALVQVACPHCAFRMILDFAAANDAGLVEQGMRMASGFRSAADYHASLQVAASPAELEAEVAEATPVRPRPEPIAEPVRPRPERIAAEPARPRSEPVSPAPPPPRPLAPTPSLEPVRPAAQTRTEPSEDARTEVHMLPQGERRVPVDIPPVRRRPAPVDEDDIAVMVPAPATERVRSTAGLPPATDEVAIDIDDDDDDAASPTLVTEHAVTPARRPPPRTETPAATAAERAAHPAFGDEGDEDLPTMVVSTDAREAARREMEAERDALAARAQRARPEPAREPEVDQTPSGRERLPPHTPPGRAKVAALGDEDAAGGGRSPRRPSGEADAKRPPPAEGLPGLEDDAEQERMSTFGIVVVVFLLLIAGGLVGASIALNEGHNPDPRPLLEKLYRQYIKGQ
jgi:hypothetical protein